MSITEHNRSITEIASDTGLKEVVDAWSRLPEDVRSGIVAMVRAFSKQ